MTYGLERRRLCRRPPSRDRRMVDGPPAHPPSRRSRSPLAAHGPPDATRPGRRHLLGGAALPARRRALDAGARAARLAHGVVRLPPRALRRELGTPLVSRLGAAPRRRLGR